MAQTYTEIVFSKMKGKCVASCLKDLASSGPQTNGHSLENLHIFSDLSLLAIFRRSLELLKEIESNLTSCPPKENFLKLAGNFCLISLQLFTLKIWLTPERSTFEEKYDWVLPSYKEKYAHLFKCGAPEEFTKLWIYFIAQLDYNNQQKFGINVPSLANSDIKAEVQEMRCQVLELAFELERERPRKRKICNRRTALFTLQMLV